MKKALYSFLAFSLMVSLSSCFIFKDSAKNESPALPQKYKKTEGGLQYKIVRDVEGTQFPKVGDFIEVHILTAIGDSTGMGDSVIFSTRKINDNKPVQFQLMPASFRGDLTEGFMMLTAGDSAVMRVSVDSFAKTGAQMQPWMKEGEGMMIYYAVNLVSVKTKEQQQQAQAAQAEKQNTVDAKIIQDYLKEHNVKNAQKTASGLYYVIHKEGTGETAKAGQKVTVNYTGMTPDGNVFDSNVDPKFNHVEPFAFELGQGRVIKGWDEGVALLKKGSKATLYIPSSLAYGPNGTGPIKPNSVLIFDIEVTDIENVK